MSQDSIEAAWRILQAAQPALPRAKELEVELRDAEAAQRRGYYLPDEDERLRTTYHRYLTVRASLWEAISELRPHLKARDFEVYAIALCAASMLMRSAGYIIDLARERPVVLAKLDEAEPRYHIPRKTFTRVFQSLSSPRRRWEFRQACQFYEKFRTQILQTLQDSGKAQLAEWLEAEAALFDTRKRSLGAAAVEYTLYSLGRRAGSGYHKVMFHLFRLSGSAIAEMKQPFVKAPRSGKRVTREVIAEAKRHLKPGDFLVTRHDDAMSNLFLPGFWPHAAFYIGDAEERAALGVSGNPLGPHDVLEAKKDGVRLRKLDETLAVDAFVVFRPKVSPDELAEALSRGLAHAGKLYDFIFDFRKSERLACTEVIYRSFHGIGDWQLRLEKRSGHLALPAEDLIDQVLSKNLAEVLLIYGIDGEEIRHRQEAADLLAQTMKRGSSQ